VADFEIAYPITIANEGGYLSALEEEVISVLSKREEPQYFY
jgi:hypothetical protein